MAALARKHHDPAFLLTASRLGVDLGRVHEGLGEPLKALAKFVCSRKN